MMPKTLKIKTEADVAAVKAKVKEVTGNVVTTVKQEVRPTDATWLEIDRNCRVCGEDVVGNPKMKISVILRCGSKMFHSLTKRSLATVRPV